MAKSNSNAGNNAGNAKRLSNRTLPASPGTGASQGAPAAKSRTPATSMRGQAAKAGTAAMATKTAKTSTAKTAKRATAGRRTASGARAGSKTNQQGRQGAPSAPAGLRPALVRAPAPLRPIRTRQSRDQILATAAAASGVERPIVERVARSMAQTLQRHLIRNGSGRVEIPYLGAALWRGQEGARAARTMMSQLLGRNVQIPAKRATAVTRLRVHTALREIVARV